MIQPEPQYRAITPRIITVTAKDQTVAVGGTVVSTPDQVEITSGTLVSGHSISEVTLTGDTSAITDSGTVTSSAIKILDSSNVDVTANYLVNYVAGKLTVTEAPAHTHSFIYTGSGATITATCTADGCPLPESSSGAGDHVATLTISADGGTYDGTTAYGATITDANSIQGEAKVQYQKKTGESYGTATETAPKDAGTYKASITVGGATASVEYTIAQAATTITVNPTAGYITYGQTLANSSLTGGTASVAGGFTWKDSTIAPAVSDSQTTEYDVVFTPTDGNYGTTECKVKLTVNKADSAVTKAPEGRKLAYTGSEQALVTRGEATGGEMQYALGTKDAATQPYTPSIPKATDIGT